jgi:hypothetical protein
LEPEGEIWSQLWSWISKQITDSGTDWMTMKQAEVGGPRTDITYRNLWRMQASKTGGG